MLRTTLFCLLSILFWLPSAEVAAQTRIPREVSFGVVGGANLSTYSFSPKVTQQSSTGYTAGVAVRYIEETFFGLQAELLLTRRGFSDKLEEFPQWNFERQLTYIEMPVLAHVYFRMGNRNEIAIDAGPKLGFYLSDKVVGNLPADYGRPTSEAYGYEYLHHELPVSKKFDYGIQAGLGYEFKFSPKVSVQLSGRFYYGLANLWPDAKTDNYEQSSNTSIQVVCTLWWHHIIRGKLRPIQSSGR